MRKLLLLALLTPVMMFFIGCMSNDRSTETIHLRSVNSNLYQPGQQLLIIGQDLDGIRAYTQSGCCPPPAGVTAYLNFYALLSADSDFGDIGIDNRSKPHPIAADWGGGPISLFEQVQAYPRAIQAIGLSIVENQTPNGLKQIIQGDRDNEIAKLAAFFKQTETPFLLRIGYEFDGAWNYGYERRSDYIAAYRYIVDKLREAKVSNVEYVWQSSTSPADDSIDNGARENLADWYPGDDYVHWFGLVLVPASRFCWRRHASQQCT